MRFLNAKTRAACVVLALSLVPSTFISSLALADACEPAYYPSPASDEATGIAFYNETAYAYRVFWIDFEGSLQEYALVQPGETAMFNTFIGHRWMVELYASEEWTECFGPIIPSDTETCQARILWDGGIGIDAGFCEF